MSITGYLRRQKKCVEIKLFPWKLIIKVLDWQKGVFDSGTFVLFLPAKGQLVCYLASQLKAVTPNRHHITSNDKMATVPLPFVLCVLTQCFNPILSQIWTNSNIGLKMSFKNVTQWLTLGLAYNGFFHIWPKIGLKQPRRPCRYENICIL